MTEAAEAPRWRRWVRVALLRGPFWEASRKRRAMRLLALGAYVYLGVLLVLLALENRLLYVATGSNCPWHAPPADLAVEEVWLRSEDGNTIVAWWLAPPGWRPEHGAVHYSHGNGCNLSVLPEVARLWQKGTGHAVLLYDYPGYGKSTGSPSEAGCYRAGDCAYRWLVEAKKVAPADVLLVGSSLGGAIATDLATRHDHGLLVLISAFTSFPDMAQQQMPWFPARWLVRNKLDNLSKIGKVKAPVFITHGEADALIPPRMGRRLYEAAREPKRWFPIPAQPHLDPHQPEFYAAVRAFFAEVRGR
jgi:uncharacterized protein